MPSYATIDDMFVYFRANELAQRSAPENPEVTGILLREALDNPSTAIDDSVLTALARIEIALEDATLEMDSYFSVRYNLPFTDDATITVLRRPCADLARSKLFTEGMSTAQQETVEAIRQWLRDVAMGRASLPIAGAMTADRSVLRV